MPTPSKKNQPATASKPAAVAPVAVTAKPDPDALVSIFNKNPPGGDYVHHIYEDKKREDGTPIGRRVVAEYRASGREFSNVPRWVAEFWKRMYPGIIVDGTEVSKSPAAPPASNERVAALEGENSELKRRLENLEGMIAELQRSPEGAQV
jgi:hypothetical protein